MDSPTEYDIAVIGSGPGGYVAAIRAAQLGLKTVIIERDELGGICLNWGCIPSKALLRNAEVVSLFKRAHEFGITYENLEIDYSKAIDRSRSIVPKLTKGVEFLLRKNGVVHIKGEARFKNSNTIIVTPNEEEIVAKNVIVATGAKPRMIPVLPIDGVRVISSRQALENKDLPKSIVIVGGGAIGVEFASIYNAYDVKVTLVELQDRIVPLEDEDISRQLERSMSRKGITIVTSSKVEGLVYEEDHLIVTSEGSEGKADLECQQVLVAVGVQGNIEGLRLEELGVNVEKGFIEIDQHMTTSVPNIYGIGDVTGKLLLAHSASAQGVYAVERIAELDPQILSYLDMPKATYCDPQITSFGLTEAQARDEGHEVNVGKFPFQANGKALALAESDGFVKLITDASNGEILGAHIIGPEVTELLAELSMTRMLEGTVDELGWMVHSHPTLSETLKEAALDAKGQAVHI